MKPPILTNAEVWERENKRRGGNLPVSHIVSREESKEAQLDADAAYYEPLIEQAQADGYDLGIKAIEPELEQAKAEVAREMEDWLETHLYARPDRPNATMGFNDWLELKKLLSKYTGGQK